jgi:hypothetical protein
LLIYKVNRIDCRMMTVTDEYIDRISDAVTPILMDILNQYGGFPKYSIAERILNLNLGSIWQ